MYGQQNMYGGMYGGQGMGASQDGYGSYGRGAGRGGGMGGRGPMMGGPHAQYVEGKLFIGGIEPNTTKATLESYCSQWGELSDAVVIENKGYGFVTFTDPKSAMAFLEQREHMLDGKKVDVKAAVPKTSGGGSQLTKKMFVGGTGETTDDELKAHFSEYGDIEDALIVKTEGVSRGFGFVTYKDEISVEKCLVVQHTVAGKRVEVKRAVPKEAMAAAAAAPGGYGMSRGGGRMGAGGGYGGGRGYGAAGQQGYGGAAGYGAGGYNAGYGMNAMGTMGGYNSYGNYGMQGAYGYGAANTMGTMGYGAAAGGYGRAATGRGGAAMAARYRPY